MNFFDAQDQSHRNTRRLIVIMTLAVVVVVASVTAAITLSVWLATNPVGSANFVDWTLANPQFPAWIALGTTVFIGIASLFRIVTLRQGGSKVARDLGGTLILPGDNDPLRRRLYNVVEEMAIASGVPTPEVYVLDHEAGINAFAAGFSLEDAAVAVTRGTLETLERDELQGVIAHEFSHIFNGDMRLNIQLMGPMFGILAIGLLGRILLRSGRSAGRSRGKASGGAAVLALGAGLAITGYAGLLLARLIKAGVSRQREYLADASAVQFTRQTSGIVGALKKIGGFREHSTLESNDAEEVSHMLFASGFNSTSNWLATHPPLFNRIHALDPTFSKQQFEQLHTESSQLDRNLEQINQFAGEARASSHTNVGQSAEPETLIDTIGQPTELHYQLAQQFRRAIPIEISEALESEYLVMLLIPALILHPNADSRIQQLHLVEQQLGTQRRKHVESLSSAVMTFDQEIRLPLLNLALPRAKEQPPGRLEYLNDLLTQLAMQDERLELFEYALLRSFQLYISKAAQPAAPRKWQTLKNRTMSVAAANLLDVFTELGFKDKSKGQIARAVGLAKLNMSRDMVSNDNWIIKADNALQTLRQCTPKDKSLVVEAMLAAALSDAQISSRESETLRAFCSLLECPLPLVLQKYESNQNTLKTGD